MSVVERAGPVAVLLLIAACERTPAPSATADSGSSDTEARVRQALQGGDASSVAPLLPTWGERAYACKTDSDCVVSARQDGRCCDSVCDATNAHSREFDQALARAHEPCDPDLCPAKSCLPPRVRRIARCVSSRCGIETRDLDGGVLRKAGEKPCACDPGDPLCACP